MFRAPAANPRALGAISKATTRLVRMAPLVALYSVLNTASAESLDAQQAPMVGPGADVRVWATDPAITRVDARVLARERDTLLLQTSRPLEQFKVPIASVQRLEVRTSKGPCRGDRRVGCALLGFAAGTAVGLAVGFAAGSGDEFCGRCAVFLTAPVGGLLGLLVGGNAGRDRWEPVPLLARSDR